jgi:hypothetical protein
MTGPCEIVTNRSLLKMVPFGPGRAGRSKIASRCLDRLSL